jgi:hypothetical protein
VLNAGKNSWALFGTSGEAEPKEVKKSATETGVKALKYDSSDPWIYLGSRTGREGIRADSGVVARLERANADVEGLQYDTLVKMWNTTDIDERAQRALADKFADTEKRMQKFSIAGPLVDALTGKLRGERQKVAVEDPATGCLQLRPAVSAFPKSSLLDGMSPLIREIALDDHRLHFKIDQEGRVVLPIADLRGNVDLDDVPDPWARAGGHNMRIIRALATHVGEEDSSEISDIVKLSRINKGGEGPFVYSTQIEGNVGAALATFVAHPLRVFENSIKQDISSEETAAIDVVRKAFEPLAARSSRTAPVDRKTFSAKDLVDIYSDEAATESVGQFRKLSQAFMTAKDYETAEDTIAVRTADGVVDDALFAYSASEAPNPWRIFTARRGGTASLTPPVGFLIPPMPLKKQKALVDDLVADGWQKSGTDWRRYGSATDTEKFNLANWLLGKQTGALQPSRLVIKAGLKHVNYGTVLGSDGTIEFINERGEVNSKGLRRITDYADAPDSYDVEKDKPALLKFLPANEEDATMQQASTKAKAVTVIGSKSDPVYRAKNIELERVAGALNHAASICQFGEVLSQTFPSGISVKSPRTGRHQIFRFDPAGVLYVVTGDDPNNVDSWRPLPATIFDAEGPYNEYMAVLKALSAWAQGAGKASVVTADGVEISPTTYDTTDNYYFRSSGQTNLTAQTQFVNWCQQLDEKIADALRDKDSPFKETVKALTSFPTMAIKARQVFSDDPTDAGAVDSFLASCAIERDDEQARRYIDRLYAGKAAGYLSAREQRDKALVGYNTFAKWVRANYDLEALKDPNGTFDVGDRVVTTAEAKQILHDRLVEHFNAVHSMTTHVARHLHSTMPAEIKNPEARARFSDKHLVGIAGNLVFDHVFDPIRKWILQSWDWWMAVADRSWDILTSPRKYFGRMVPGFIEAAYEAAKVFFQRATAVAIEEAYRDEEGEIELRSGRRERVSYSRVRQAARSFMDEALDVRPYTASDITKLGELTNSSLAAERASNFYGDRFSQLWTPQFANGSVIDGYTNKRTDLISIRVPKVKGKKTPSTMVIVDIPLLNAAAAGLDQMVIRDELRGKPAGITVRSSDIADMDDVPPELDAWWQTEQDRLRIDRFRKRVPSSSIPDGLANLSPQKVKIVSDKNDVPHLRLHYTTRQLFGDQYNAAHVAAYGKKVQSRSTVRDRTEESYRPADKMRLVGLLLEGEYPNALTLRRLQKTTRERLSNPENVGAALKRLAIRTADMKDDSPATHTYHSGATVSAKEYSDRKRARLLNRLRKKTEGMDVKSSIDYKGKVLQGGQAYQQATDSLPASAVRRIGNNPEKMATRMYKWGKVPTWKKGVAAAGVAGVAGAAAYGLYRYNKAAAAKERARRERAAPRSAPTPPPQPKNYPFKD